MGNNDDNCEYIRSKQARCDAKKYLDSESIPSEATARLIKNLPKKLYKYCNLNVFSLNNLKSKKISLSLPIIFNDPYDTFFKMEDETSYFEKLIKKNPQASSEEQQQARSHDGVQATIHQDAQQFLKDSSRDKLYIGSFASNNKNPLMWPHYAGANSGICIEYDITDWDKADTLYPVIYIDQLIQIKYPKLRKYAADSQHLDYLIESICKNSSWNYEEEWRSIVAPSDYANQKNRLEICAPTVTAIYLGPNFLVKWLKIKEYINDSGHNDRHKSKLKKEFDKIYVPFCCWLQRNKDVSICIVKTSNSEYEYQAGNPIQDKFDVCSLDRDILLEQKLINPIVLKHFDI